MTAFTSIPSLPMKRAKAFSAVVYPARVPSSFFIMNSRPKAMKSKRKVSAVSVSRIWATTSSTVQDSRTKGERLSHVALILAMSSPAFWVIVAFFILPERVRSESVQTRVVGSLRETPLKVTRTFTGHVPSLRRPPWIMMALNVITTAEGLRESVRR